MGGGPPLAKAAVTAVLLFKVLALAAELERSIAFRIWHRQFVALRQLSDQTRDGLNFSPFDKPKSIADSTSTEPFADFEHAWSIPLHDDG